MSNKILLSKRAKADFKSIGHYTKKMWGVKKRDQYLSKVSECFGKLLQFPLSGKLRLELDKNIRSIRMEMHIIYYYCNDTNIQIVAILHEKMEVDIYLH